MTDALGGQTVGFVKISEGAKDHLGVPAKVEAVTQVPGCLFRELSQTETSQLTERHTVRVRCAPDLPVTTTMTANDFLRYEGVDYQVVGGSDVKYDLDGVADHVVVEAIREVG